MRIYLVEPSKLIQVVKHNLEALLVDISNIDRNTRRSTFCCMVVIVVLFIIVSPRAWGAVQGRLLKDSAAKFMGYWVHLVMKRLLYGFPAWGHFCSPRPPNVAPVSVLQTSGNP